MRLMFAAMLLALAAAPALAMEVLAGNAMALDGDTIEEKGTLPFRGKRGPYPFYSIRFQDRLQ